MAFEVADAVATTCATGAFTRTQGRSSATSPHVTLTTTGVSGLARSEAMSAATLPTSASVGTRRSMVSLRARGDRVVGGGLALAAVLFSAVTRRRRRPWRQSWAHRFACRGHAEHGE